MLALLLRPRLVLWGAFLLVALFLAVNAFRINSFIWLIDELLWAKAARGYAEGAALVPEAHGQPIGPPNGLYPLLIAPVYALLDASAAFHATHVLNGIFFASALFPVYLLGRRLGLEWRWALAGGLLSVLVPWSVATLVVMTESVAYPTFLWALYAVTVAVAEPRPKHDMLALLAIGVTSYARTQFVVLAGVLVAAILARELLERDGGTIRRARWRAHLPFAVFLAVFPIAYVVLRSLGVDLVGTYAGLFTAQKFPPGLWGASVLHVAYLLVGALIVPFVLYVAWLARVGRDGGTAHERSFALVGTLAFAAIIYEAGFFAQTLVPGNPLQERYAFYVVPVLTLGMLLLLAGDTRKPSPRLSLVAGGAAAVAFIAGAGFGGDEANGPFRAVAAASRGLNLVISQRLGDIVGMRPAEAIALMAFVLSLVLVPVLAAGRRRRWIAPAIVGVLLGGQVAQTTWLLDETRDGINFLYPSQMLFENETPRNWIDRAVGEDAEVGNMYGFLGVPDNTGQWAWTELFNYSVRTGVMLEGRINTTGFAAQHGRVDRRTGAIRLPQRPPQYVVAPGNDPTLRVHGEEVARARWGAVVLKPAAPWRAEFLLVGGSYSGDANGEKPLRLYTWPESGTSGPQRVRLELLAPADGPPQLPWRIRSGDEVRRGTLAQGEKTVVEIDAQPDGPARSTLRVEPQAAQAHIDGRVVGLRVAVLSVSPPAR